MLLVLLWGCEIVLSIMVSSVFCNSHKEQGLDRHRSSVTSVGSNDGADESLLVRHPVVLLTIPFFKLRMLW